MQWGVLKRRCLHRMAHQGILAAWTTWLGRYEQHVYEQRLLRASAARLRMPQLTAALCAWRTDYESTRRAAEVKQTCSEASRTSF